MTHETDSPYTLQVYLNTEADKIASTNKWNYPFALGYLDGKRDHERRMKPYCDRLEMTDYAHGYWKGFTEIM